MYLELGELQPFPFKWKSTVESESNSLFYLFTSLQLVMTHGCKHSRGIGFGKETQPTSLCAYKLKSFINFNNSFRLQNLFVEFGDITVACPQFFHRVG